MVAIKGEEAALSLEAEDRAENKGDEFDGGAMAVQAIIKAAAIQAGLGEQEDDEEYNGGSTTAPSSIITKAAKFQAGLGEKEDDEEYNGGTGGVTLECSSHDCAIFYVPKFYFCKTD